MRDIRVMVVDDQPLMGQALSIFVNSAAGMRCVAVVTDGRDAVLKARELVPDVVLMDMQMPGMNGIDATAAITGLGQPITVVGITTFEIGDYMMPALKAGARGFLLKDARPEEVVQAVRTAHSGALALAPSANEHLLELAADPVRPGAAANHLEYCSEPPTAREMEVLELLCQGHSNRKIARQLFVTETTVKANISRLLAKFRASNRVELVVRAVQSGMVAIN